VRFALGALLIILAAACGNTHTVDADGYGQIRPSPDGIGKTWMGREISHVMGHQGASWLERSERQREERTDLLVEALPLQPSSVVADIGAGTGYFSFRIAKRVPQGQVYAVDIQQQMLDIVDQRIAAGHGNNVKPVLGTDRSPGLPDQSVDLVLLVDAYHEFAFPREMAAGMLAALKPGGRLVLIEYRAEDPAVPIKRLHKMSEQQAIREMTSAGFLFERNLDLLPQQHFLVFRRPG
jgi:ubiquinone/menaquinone biosynthesis C-methylase UbiE